MAKTPSPEVTEPVRTGTQASSLPVPGSYHCGGPWGLRGSLNSPALEETLGWKWEGGRLSCARGERMILTPSFPESLSPGAPLRS